jgi:hypothetical protein
MLSLCVSPAVSAEESIQLPKSWVRRGVFLIRTSGFYSESVRFLSYAFQNVSHVTYGETSVLSRKLASSDQLSEILESALSQGLTEAEGTVSFYDGSDLEYSIGACWYTMRIEGNTAIFVLKDTYDFTEVREGGSISNILNNLGYEWQKNGTITPYTWMVKVGISLEN